MKYSVIFQAFLIALFGHIVYASVIDTRSLVTRDDQSPNTEDLIAYKLPDGRRRIDFYDNGALEGYAIETDDGGKAAICNFLATLLTSCSHVLRY